MKKTISKNGFITLLSVVLVSTIGLAVVMSLSVILISSSRSGGDLYKLNQAKSLSNACAEVALQEIRDLSSFSGSDNLVLGAGDCNYTVTNLGGENRQIDSTGTVLTIVHKIQIIIDAIDPDINIVSWGEVDAF